MPAGGIQCTLELFECDGADVVAAPWLTNDHHDFRGLSIDP